MEVVRRIMHTPVVALAVSGMGFEIFLRAFVPCETNSALVRWIRFFVCSLRECEATSHCRHLGLD